MGRKLYSNSLLDMIDDFADRMAIDDFEALSPGIGASALRPKGSRPNVQAEISIVKPSFPETTPKTAAPRLSERESGFARLGIQVPKTLGQEVELPKAVVDAPGAPLNQQRHVEPSRTVSRNIVVERRERRPQGQLTGLLQNIESQKKAIATQAIAQNRQSARRWIARGAGLAMDLFAFSSASLLLIGGAWLAVSRSIRPDGAAASAKPWQVAWSWVQYFKPAEMALGFAVFFALYHLVFKVVVGRTVGQAVSRRLSPESDATEQGI